MATDIPQNLKYTSIGVEGVVEVNAHLVGGGLIDSLRRTFTIGSQLEQGDYFMDRSLDLLEKHLELMLLSEQITIQRGYMKARDLKHELHSDGYNGSAFQRFFQARKYRHLSRKTYEIVKVASDRVRENPLINQLAKATQRSPFTDSHALSSLSDINVNDLDRMSVSTYQEETTNEIAVVVDLVAQDESVQHVVATYPTEAFSGDRTDREDSQSIASVPSAISLHLDNGSSSRLIAASPPDVSDERTDEQLEAETGTLNSIVLSKLGTSSGNHPHPVMRASVPPTDGDTYTRSFVSRKRKPL